MRIPDFAIRNLYVLSKARLHCIRLSEGTLQSYNIEALQKAVSDIEFEYKEYVMHQITHEFTWKHINSAQFKDGWFVGLDFCYAEPLGAYDQR